MALVVTQAVLKNRTLEPVDFECADAAAIEKGTLLRLVDARKVSGVPALGAMCAGISRREKIASDGRTQISVFMDGIFDMKASGVGGIAVGDAVMMSETINHVARLDEVLSGSSAKVIGHALEAGDNDEVIQIRLKL